MEKKIELVFVINAMAFAKARLALAKELEKHNMHSKFVSYSKECENYLIENGAEVINIVEAFRAHAIVK